MSSYDLNTPQGSRKTPRPSQQRHQTPQSPSTHHTRQSNPQHPIKQRGVKHPRLVFWAKTIIIIFLIISIGITARAIFTYNDNSQETSWLDELKNGHFMRAADKFSTFSSDAISHTLKTKLSTDKIIADFHEALPHLRQAGYVLTELEVEIGLSPKLIPHFYHDDSASLHLEDTLAALKGNSIGTTLILALTQTQKLQDKIKISDMKFNHIEIELGPIPALKLQYKNDDAIKDYIHQKKSL